MNFHMTPIWLIELLYLIENKGVLYLAVTLSLPYFILFLLLPANLDNFTKKRTRHGYTLKYKITFLMKVTEYDICLGIVEHRQVAQ